MSNSDAITQQLSVEVTEWWQAGVFETVAVRDVDCLEPCSTRDGARVANEILN